MQAGFTLIELVIVIIIIGILAAVAIPNMSSTADEARLAKQQAVLGALKSAWSIAYAVKKTPPSCAEVVAQMADPTCTAGTGTIACAGVKDKAGTADAEYTCTETSGAVASPSALVCAEAGC